MVWIKICGITNLEDARVVARLKADSIGFILSTDSPRRVQLSTAERIAGVLYNESSKISVVGVFVNEKPGYILKCSRSLGLDYIQLSGDEDRDFLKNLKRAAGRVKIIKSIRIKNKNENKKDCSTGNTYKIEIIKKIENLEGYADFVLLDSYRKGAYGGTGKTFDWDILKNYKSRIPVILSGGLDPENVRRAIDIVKPFGVDASSGLEIYPGRKDPEKVRKFVNAVR